MNPTPTVVILGMRGSGKSSVGAEAAAILGVRFIDLDAEVLARGGFGSVREFWEARGQDAFRAAEVDTLRALFDAARASDQRPVIALGGGTPTAPGARELLDARRTTREIVAVYLRCRLDTLRARLAATLAQDANRPSVRGGDPLDELGDLLRERDPVYRASSDETIDADDSDVGSLAELVIQAARR